ncbi:MAG: hypothetical protein ALECFALPRED_010426 [Alectoria fallacina]|uniref:UBA domain-containing protein n=1 Tax=Alectoria fallacina TaxID=1903189 RepID=A0A8H3PK48_9LECA|nr:MAG: hypothetical protein ALECFALPRED_010426 [Alectoria fallacina]
MDDLSSVDWAPSNAPSAGRQHPPALGNYYPTLRPAPPLSGNSTPSVFPPLGGIGQPPNNIPPRSSDSTPANDSFANLVAFSGQQSTKNLSLQEQQKRLEEERAKQEAEKRRQFDARFGSVQSASWDTLGDGRTTPNRITSPPTYTATNEYGGQRLSKIIHKPFAGIPAPPSTRSSVDDDNDLFSAFNASAPVDRSSHMSPPSLSPSLDGPNGFGSSGAPNSSPMVKGLNGSSGGHTEENDDDPFGLGVDGFFKKSNQDAIVKGKSEEEDDVLGLLGRPISEFPKPQPRREEALEPASDASLHPQERAIAELVDMGFTPEKSRVALEATESGTDVQAAVGWLLSQAHEESRNELQSQLQEDSPSAKSGPQQLKRTPGRRKSSGGGSAKPAWMREQERNGSSERRQDSRSPANGEKDPSQYAAEIGTKMFKTANSLWKTGTKRLNQAVAEFNSDSDSNQPKWMKEAQSEAGVRKPRPPQREPDANDHDRMARKAQQQSAARQMQPNVTDEALMLEAVSRPPPRKARPKADVPQELSRPPLPSRSREPQKQSMPQPKFMQEQASRDPKAKLSRQAIEEEASRAYISPARRKKTTSKPSPAEQEPDLLFDSSQSSYRPAPISSRPTPAIQAVKPPTTSLPTRSPPHKRNIPAISSFALQASTKARQEGSSAFKLGDYALATTLYSTGITAIPSRHPLVLPILTNRALAHLKTGDPKAAIADSKSALDLIGPSRGISETVDLGGQEGVKPMTTYWEKAMTRQAEALEQLERWSEAATVWKACVEAGVGGATSIAGRNRCEKAAAGPPQLKPSSVRKPAAPKPRPKVSALDDFALESAQSAEAVSRLRAANAAADRVDDEKFALADVVDVRVKKWRLGKESNLRALLSTLQNVLWEGSGWKEIGMGELLMPGKVKINYMKGIAKVHPDKLPMTATTEQKMISAAVFATLNEAWEKFKQENNL